MYESIGKNVNTETDEIEKQKQIYGELLDLFPALQKYKTEHNSANLQKLCVEVEEFCKSIYASTQNPQERQVFFNMIDKLNSL